MNGLDRQPTDISIHSTPHLILSPQKAALHVHAAELTLGRGALEQLDGPALAQLLAEHHARHHPTLPLPPHLHLLSSAGTGSKDAAKLTIAEEAEAVRREVEVVKLALAGARARLFLLDLLGWPGVLAAVHEAGGFGPLEEAAGLLVAHTQSESEDAGEASAVAMEEMEEDLHLGVFGDVAGRFGRWVDGRVVGCVGRPSDEAHSIGWLKNIDRAQGAAGGGARGHRGGGVGVRGAAGGARVPLPRP